MQHILDASGWRAVDDFYAALLSAIGAPSWHGHNLDALEDTLGDGVTNGVQPPLEIAIINGANVSSAVRDVLDRFSLLVRDLASRGVPITVALTP
jgi:RNAse (barnase) inhibitor barstar